MKLQDRNLSIGKQGADVKLLHEELRVLDFNIPQAEVLVSVMPTGPCRANFGMRYRPSHGGGSRNSRTVAF